MAVAAARAKFTCGCTAIVLAVFVAVNAVIALFFTVGNTIAAIIGFGTIGIAAIVTTDIVNSPKIALFRGIFVAIATVSSSRTIGIAAAIEAKATNKLAADINAIIAFFIMIGISNTITTE